MKIRRYSDYKKRYALNNPIASVDGIPILPPSGWELKCNDMSKPSAGRDENGEMHKERIGRAIRIDLTWSALSAIELQEILDVFRSEYFTVIYRDPEARTGWNEAVFYAGDISYRMYSSALEIFSDLKIPIISRGDVFDTIGYKD